MPLLQGDFPGFGDVTLEDGGHLGGEFRPHHNHIDLVVVEEAAPIEVGGADRGPDPVDERRLGVQHAVLALVDPHARIQELAQAHPDAALVLPLDVTNNAQVIAAVRGAVARFGGVDVLVNNAGYGYRAAIEEGDDADVRRLFDTNFFGAVSIIKAVLPGMRARRSGAIVNISSIGARVTPVGSGYYSATKAALEAMSFALRKELQPLGITVMAVEPGGFRTDFAGRSLTQSATPIADYADTAGQRRKEKDTSDGTQPGDPHKGALAILTAIDSAEAPALLVLGRDAVAGFGAVQDAERDELAKWGHLSESTDLDE